MAALCQPRTRLFTALRSSRRSLTSATTDASEKRLFSPDDWTAFQVERAERSTLGQSLTNPATCVTGAEIVHQSTSSQNLARHRLETTRGNLTIPYIVQPPRAT
jgi:hypothetical protein